MNEMKTNAVETGLTSRQIKMPNGDYMYNWFYPDGTPLLKGNGAKDMYETFRGGWGCFQRKSDGKWNFVDMRGNLLSQTWFKNAKPFGKLKEDGPGWVFMGIKDGWKAIYGRNADGTPALSEKPIAADNVGSFSCGLAIVKVNGYTKMYVDAELNEVGPGFRFEKAEDFVDYTMGGKWAKVTIDETRGWNMMDDKGNLMFGNGLKDSYGKWPMSINPSKNYSNFRNVMANSAANDSYMFLVDSNDWGKVDAIGLGDMVGTPLVEKRLAIYGLMFRTDLTEGRGFAVIDLHGNVHPICLLDGRPCDR